MRQLMLFAFSLKVTWRIVQMYSFCDFIFNFKNCYWTWPLSIAIDSFTRMIQSLWGIFDNHQCNYTNVLYTPSHWWIINYPLLSYHKKCIVITIVGLLFKTRILSRRKLRFYAVGTKVPDRVLNGVVGGKS